MIKCAGCNELRCIFIEELQDDPVACYECLSCGLGHNLILPKPPLPKSHWIHKKGGLYEVISVGKDSETKEPVVLYKSLDHGSYWSRPLVMWTSDRFRPIETVQRECLHPKLSLLQMRDVTRCPDCRRLFP
jgi:hypothetical protein